MTRSRERKNERTCRESYGTFVSEMPNSDSQARQAKDKEREQSDRIRSDEMVDWTNGSRGRVHRAEDFLAETW